MSMVRVLEKLHRYSSLGTRLKRLLLSLTVISLLIVGCQKEEAQEEEYIPISTQQDSIASDELYVSGIGQYTGFNLNGDVVEMHPYYDLDYKVSIRKIDTSDNNFWYDFISAQGYTMEGIKFHKSGVMTLATSTMSYGYYTVDDSTAIFAYSSDLPASYVSLALEHTELVS